MAKVINSILGFAIGDAMGCPVESFDRKKCMKYPVTTMVGHGTHDVPAGYFTDDTSMVLCEMDSFIKKECIDYDDIMTKFSSWVLEGEYTPGGEAIGLGPNCKAAIREFNKGNKSSLECGVDKENDNGALMRILPLVFYIYYNALEDKEINKLIDNYASITHRHEISKMACFIYSKYLLSILRGNSIEVAYEEIKNGDYSNYSSEIVKKYDRIISNNIYEYKLKDILSNGCVINTLECVLWVLHNTDSYKHAIIGAVNLGGDTDTIGALVGGVAGILYSFDSIPKEWIKTLVRKDYIVEMATKYDNKIKESILKD